MPYNPSTAAPLLGVKPITVNKYCQKFLDPARYKVGKYWILDDEALELLRQKIAESPGPGNPNFGPDFHKKDES